MSGNVGTLVGAAIRPINSLDLISTAYANEIKGGIHGYETITERDSIIVQRRQWGMLVTVYNDPTPENNKTYQLKYNNFDTDLMNLLNWVEYTGTSLTNMSEWQNSVINIATTVPVSPNDGDRYLVGTDQSASVIGSPWAGNPGGFISQYNSSTRNWTNTLPTNGMTVRVDNQDNSLYKYEGTYSTGAWYKEKITQVYSSTFTGDGLNYTATIPSQFTTYENDSIFQCKFNVGNTGSVRININGIGLIDLRKPSINGLVDLVTNDILPDNIYTICYDSDTNNFQFIKTYSNDAINIKYYVEPTDYIVVPQYCQYWVYGDLTVDGTIVNYGKVIIADGQLIIGTSGTVENFGEIDLISINEPVGTYKAYTATLTQVGTASPIAIVLENTIGTLTLSYISVGHYRLTSTTPLPTNMSFCPQNFSVFRSTDMFYLEVLQNVNVFELYTRNATSNAAFDNVLSNTPIEIRLYN